MENEQPVDIDLDSENKQKGNETKEREVFTEEKQDAHRLNKAKQFREQEPSHRRLKYFSALRFRDLNETQSRVDSEGYDNRIEGHSKEQEFCFVEEGEM